GVDVPGLGARVAGNLLDGLANAMGRLILDIIGGTLHEGEMGLWITPVLRSRGPFGRIVFSGGVAEYIYGRGKREFGDLGPRHAADYHSLRALCQGIVEALPAVRNGRPLLLVVDADIAGIVGALLQQEFKVGGSLVCIDQVQLREFDYIDIGRRLPAQDVVPVVVKSLVFH